MTKNFLLLSLLTSVAGCMHVATIRDVAQPIESRLATFGDVTVMLADEKASASLVAETRRYRAGSDGSIVATISGQLISLDPIVPFDTEISLEVTYKLAKGKDAFFVNLIDLSQCSAPVAHAPIAALIESQYCSAIGDQFASLWQAPVLPRDTIFPSKRLLGSTMQITTAQGGVDGK